MPTKKYGFENKELKNLKNECWDDIPFLDGAYRISNYGRIKRLPRDVIASNGKVVHLKEKIMCSYPEKQINKTVGDEVYNLVGSVTVNKKLYKFSIPRLIYYCFIQKFPLDDYSLVIIPKDGDGKNIRTSNLQLASLSHRTRRIFLRERLKRTAETTYQEYLRTGSVHSSNPYCRQVSQYTAEGEYMRTFPSIRAASLITGVPDDSIVSVLKGRQIRGGGFAWSYGKPKKVDVQSIRRKNIERRNRLVGRKVTQYSLKGKRIASYYTIADAARKVNINDSDIHAVLNGKQQTAAGYRWVRGFGKATLGSIS